MHSDARVCVKFVKKVLLSFFKYASGAFLGGQNVCRLFGGAYWKENAPHKRPTCFNFFVPKIFNDISERNSDYSDTPDFRKRWVGVVTFLVLEMPDYESAICIRTHDTGRSFEPIFMKFTWLVRVHSRVNPIVFGNNRPNRTTDVGENVAPELVFRV